MTVLRNLHAESVELLSKLTSACAHPDMAAAYGEGYQVRNALIGKLFVPQLTNYGEFVAVEDGVYPTDGVAFMVTNGMPMELPKCIVAPDANQRSLALTITWQLLPGIFNELGIKNDPYERWDPGDTLHYEGNNAQRALAKCLTFEHRVSTQDGGLEESVTLFTRPMILASNRTSIQGYPAYRLGVAFHEIDHAIRRLQEPAVLSARFRGGLWVSEDEDLAYTAQALFQMALEKTAQYKNIQPNNI